MHVTLAGLVLFLHIGVAIGAFMMAALVHAAMPALARATDVAQMRSWAAVLHRVEPLFPIAALLLLGLGSWLIHLSGGDFAWSDGWIITAVSTLVVIEAAGGMVLAPRGKALVEMVQGTPDGPVPQELRRAAVDPGVWYVGHTATFGFLGVVFLMASKPSGAWAPVIVVVAVAVGLAAAKLQLSRLAPLVAGEVPAQRAQTESVPEKAKQA